MSFFNVRVKRRRLTPILCVIPALFSLAGACSANSLTLAVLGPGTSSTFSGQVGQHYQVDVYAGNYTDLYSWQFDLSWDPSILLLNQITEGSGLASAGATYFVPGSIDNITGTSMANADTVLGPGPGANGTQGLLAYFDFSAIGSGSTTLSLTNVILLDSNLNDLLGTTSSATATISGASVDASVPEPVNIGLVFLGGVLCFIASIVRRYRRAFACEF